MQFEGAVLIQAPRAHVWAFLTDPERVGACAPGLESLEILAPHERFRAVASIGFGSIRVRFVSDVEWLDLDAPNRARMKVHGTAPGSAIDATSEMILADGPEGATRMNWSADVNVVGTIASLAARLMSGVARRLTDRFFEQVRRKIEEPRAFRFGPVPLEEAEGKILGHNVAALDGTRALRKGRPLTAEDINLLRQLGRRVVYVAELGPEDVGEDAAARRIGQAALGDGLRLSASAGGRVNLVATIQGVLRVDAERVLRVNASEGVTLATLVSHSPVRPGQVVATLKVIPFAVPEAMVRASETVVTEGGPILRVDALVPCTVGLIVSGSASARERIVQGLETPLRTRVESLGSTLGPIDFVPLEDEADEAALAAALRRQVDSGAGLVILAGETAIVDRHDIAPRAIERAGGEVAGFGAPVDPGNLLLVGYLGATAILGAPGCARSSKPNVVDLVLPRLLAGERLTRTDIASLGHGGLLEDVAERPMPRSDLV
jgi:molybdenum cofactor cytidylyltransferase